MKHLTAYIIAGLILSVAFNVLQCDSAKQEELNRNQEVSRFQAEQTRKLSVISQRDSAISTLLASRKKDSLAHAKTQSGYKARIIDLKQANKWTGVTFTTTDWKDTTIALQDSLIIDLESERDTLYLTDNKAIDSLQKSKAEIFTMWQAEYQQRVKAQNRYDELRSRNFTAGPGIGIDITGRPTVNFSVQYKLVSFRIGRKR